MTDTIFSQILKIRDSGLVNMLDCTAVQRIAFDNNMFELANYIEEYRSEYFKFILHGKEP